MAHLFKCLQLRFRENSAAKCESHPVTPNHLAHVRRLVQIVYNCVIFVARLRLLNNTMESTKPMFMKKGIIITGGIVLFATVGAVQAQVQGGISSTTNSITSWQENPEPLYRDMEGSLDLFGGGTLDEHDIDRLSGARIHNDGRLGLGAGGSFFFVRNLGIMGEAYSENPHPKLVGEASGSVVLRFPLGESGFSPYIFAGGGHQFEPQDAAFAHGGAGLEFRFSPNVGVFIDGRWVSTDRIGNYGMARAGFRFAL